MPPLKRRHDDILCTPLISIGSARDYLSQLPQSLFDFVISFLVTPSPIRNLLYIQHVYNKLFQSLKLTKKTWYIPIHLFTFAFGFNSESVYKSYSAMPFSLLRLRPFGIAIKSTQVKDILSMNSLQYLNISLNENECNLSSLSNVTILCLRLTKSMLKPMVPTNPMMPQPLYFPPHVKVFYLQGCSYHCFCIPIPASVKELYLSHVNFDIVLPLELEYLECAYVSSLLNYHLLPCLRYLRLHSCTFHHLKLPASIIQLELIDLRRFNFVHELQAFCNSLPQYTNLKELRLDVNLPHFGFLAKMSDKITYYVSPLSDICELQAIYLLRLLSIPIKK